MTLYFRRRVAYSCSCDCWRRLLVSAGCSGGAVALVVEAANSCRPIPSWQLHSAMPERRRDKFWRFLLVGRSSHLPCGLTWLTTGWSVHRVGDGSDQSSATLPINTHLFHHCLITLRGHISHAGSPVVGGLAYCTLSPHVHFSSAGSWHVLLLFCTHFRRWTSGQTVALTTVLLDYQ